MFTKKEIYSKEGVLHFRRWRLLETKYFRIYIHKLFESDRDFHMHSHPWHFLSIILWGGYFEKQTDETYKIVRFLSAVFHKANEYHKITLIKKPTTTLVFAFGKYRPWGYFTSKGHMSAEEYRTRKNNGTLLE